MRRGPIAAADTHLRLPSFSAPHLPCYFCNLSGGLQVMRAGPPQVSSVSDVRIHPFMRSYEELQPLLIGPKLNFFNSIQEKIHH